MDQPCTMSYTFLYLFFSDYVLNYKQINFDHKLEWKDKKYRVMIILPPL